jgi:hypothetical protein
MSRDRGRRGRGAFAGRPTCVAPRRGGGEAAGVARQYADLAGGALDVAQRRSATRARDPGRARADRGDGDRAQPAAAARRPALADRSLQAGRNRSHRWRGRVRLVVDLRSGRRRRPARGSRRAPRDRTRAGACRVVRRRRRRRRRRRLGGQHPRHGPHRRAGEPTRGPAHQDRPRDQPRDRRHHAARPRRHDPRAAGPGREPGRRLGMGRRRRLQPGARSGSHTPAQESETRTSPAGGSGCSPRTPRSRTTTSSHSTQAPVTSPRGSRSPSRPPSPSPPTVAPCSSPRRMATRSPCGRERYWRCARISSHSAA